MLTHILAAHARGRGIDGPLNIQSELKTVGIQVRVNRIKRLHKLANIKCIHQRQFRVTTDSKHKLLIAPNLLNRQFTQPVPNKVWAADITPYRSTGQALHAH